MGEWSLLSPMIFYEYRRTSFPRSVTYTTWLTWWTKGRVNNIIGHRRLGLKSIEVHRGFSADRRSEHMVIFWHDHSGERYLFKGGATFDRASFDRIRQSCFFPLFPWQAFDRDKVWRHRSHLVLPSFVLVPTSKVFFFQRNTFSLMCSLLKFKF